MKFTFGQQDWKTLEAGQQNCYLLTNGQGGFSSLSMINSSARSDQALLMACNTDSNLRSHMITNLDEKIRTGGKEYSLISQEFVNFRNNKTGFRYQEEFQVELFPVWSWKIGGIAVRKTVAMKYRSNCIAVYYTMRNLSEQEAEFVVSPYMQFVSKGEKPSRNQIFSITEDRIESNGLCLYYKSDGAFREVSQQYIDDLYYHYDAKDGRNAIGAAVQNHELKWVLQPGQSREFFIIYDTEPVTSTAAQIFEEEKQRVAERVKMSGLKTELGRQLVIAADQFIVDKASVQGRTIIAGYPFFTDWGRDTMIAISGCCTAVNRLDDTRSILRSFMKYCQNGLMPNLFPEGGNEPMYNTVDASLLFIGAVYEYYMVTEDKPFVEEAFPVIESIIEWYRKGTDYHIYMDYDGLISAGDELEQVTWMDVRCGDILPTPRHGKPVEINAYWYNSLKIAENFSELLGKSERDYGELADQVKVSFVEKFWMEDRGYLKDVLSGTSADTQLRCNQIWAVSQPFGMLSKEIEQKVVNKVYEALYTPYGLRSLDANDEEFHKEYKGAQFQRDMAYHQGTVWTFPLGGYFVARLKAYEYSEDAVRTVREQISTIEATLKEGCIGQIAEVFDGAVPSVSKGCFAQAWSVGEILKVLKILDEI